MALVTLNMTTVSGTTPTLTTRYLLANHLGSVDTVIDPSNGTIVPQESFDAFGGRGDKDAWAGSMSATDLGNARAVTHHGFTHHEHLDNVSLIHAGGRVYDPALGRFLSVDPVFQAPTNTQSVNAYSYVMNNPLSLVDSSGYAVQVACNTGSSKSCGGPAAVRA